MFNSKLLNYQRVPFKDHSLISTCHNSEEISEKFHPAQTVGDNGASTLQLSSRGMQKGLPGHRLDFPTPERIVGVPSDDSVAGDGMIEIRWKS